MNEPHQPAQPQPEPHLIPMLRTPEIPRDERAEPQQSEVEWVRKSLVVGYGESGIEDSFGFRCLPMSDALELAERCDAVERLATATVTDLAAALKRGNEYLAQLAAAQARIAELEKRLTSSERARQSLSDACDSLQAEIRGLKAAPATLPRPDKPGWWWELCGREWLMRCISYRLEGDPGQWIPATPPPPPAPKNN